MDNLELIKEVKNYPFLYDPSIKTSYEKKEKQWIEIGKKFCETVMTVKTRWRSLKDKYIMLKGRTLKHPQKRHIDRLKEYTYAKHLTFLDDTVSYYENAPLVRRPSPVRYETVPHLWNKAHTLLIIKQLALYPLLFDPKHKFYFHNFQRMAVYRKIADALRPYKPEITPDMVSRKLKTIKTQYNKEKKMRKMHIETSDTPYVPKLWFFNRVRRIYENTQEPEGSTDEMEDLAWNIKKPSYANTNKKADVSDDDDDVNDDDDDDKNVDSNSDDDVTDVDEWTTTKNITKPFEEIELTQMDHDYVHEEQVLLEDVDNEIEEVFDDNNKKSELRSNKRNELYLKCTNLLDSLVKQIRPMDKCGKNERNTCNCKAAGPSSMLGKMIESEMEKLPETIYLEAKWKIIRILEEAQRKSLRET